MKNKTSKRNNRPKCKKDSIPKMGYGQHSKNKNTISKIVKADFDEENYRYLEWEREQLREGLKKYNKQQNDKEDEN